VAVNLQNALRSVAERVEIVAYLLPGTPIEATAHRPEGHRGVPGGPDSDVRVGGRGAGASAGRLVEFRDVLRELERNPCRPRSK